jgi:hypothetical protein
MISGCFGGLLGAPLKTAYLSLLGKEYPRLHVSMPLMQKNEWKPLIVFQFGPPYAGQ